MVRALRRRVPVSALPMMTATLLLAPALQAQPAPAAPFAAVQQAVAREISGDRAFRTVAFVEQFFRLPGNRGFDASIDTVAAILQRAGYVLETRATGQDRLVYRIESRPMVNPAWTPDDASLTIVGRAAPLQRWATNHNMLAINSVSTPHGGVTAQLVDVGTGTDAEITTANVRGKIAFGEGNARVLFQRAMKLGAVGVIASQQLPAYNQQSKNRTSIQFSSIARDTLQPGWLIFVSAASRDSLKAALAAGPVQLHAVVQTRFEQRPELTLVAEIRGGVLPNERFVYSAHVQEPGANDNASGVGALAEMARAAAVLFKAKQVNPARTLTFLWGDEIRSTDRFLKEDSVRRAGVKWGMSLDMVGENTAKTGGTFLIEKMPDPSAVWVRGDDQHSEWGGRPLVEKDIRAHWFNDFMRQRCLDRAALTGWVVKSNPFEGGSDHTPFLNAQIPAVLLWHFTDQHYHTDLDRIDMVSATTLANVGNCALSGGLLLTTGSRAITLAALEELTGVAERALRTQAGLSRDTVARGANREQEQHVLDVWRDYYVAAIARISDIAVGPMDLTAAIRAAQDRVRVAATAVALR